MLGRQSRAWADAPIACAIAVLVLMPPAVFLPLMDSTIKRLVFDDSRLVSSVGTMYREVWFPFALGFLFFAVLFPWIRALLQLIVIGSIRWGWPNPYRGPFFRWSEQMRIWGMTDVVVIAGVIAYFRADIPADVTVRVGAWIYVLVAVAAYTADRTINRRQVWNAILRDHSSLPDADYASCGVCEMAVHHGKRGDKCPRCSATLERDVAKRFAPTVGAVAAAIPLVLPAYTYAFIVNDQLTAVWEHTVIGTVQMLADYGYWQFGLIVLVSGIVIPVTVLVGMIWLLLRVPLPSVKGLVLRTRVYRVLHRLVRWPMVIPFTAALAAPIVDFRGIDDIIAGVGATPLFGLIVLLMLAVRLYEPRLMWVTAGEAR